MSKVIKINGHTFLICDVDWYEFRIGYISNSPKTKLIGASEKYNESINSEDTIRYFIEPPENYNCIYVVEDFMTQYFTDYKLKGDEVLVFLPFYCKEKDKINWEEIVNFMRLNLEETQKGSNS